jgi:hypothetical protein
MQLIARTSRYLDYLQLHPRRSKISSCPFAQIFFASFRAGNKVDKVKAEGTRKKKRRRIEATTRILLLLLTMKCLLSDNDKART